MLSTGNIMKYFSIHEAAKKYSYNFQIKDFFENFIKKLMTYLSGLVTVGRVLPISFDLEKCSDK